MRFEGRESAAERKFETMWELILSVMPQPSVMFAALPLLPGEALPRTWDGELRFRGPTKFDAIQRAVAGLSSIPRSSTTECFYVAAMNALAVERGGRVANMSPGGVFPGMGVAPACFFRWRYISPTTRVPGSLSTMRFPFLGSMRISGLPPLLGDSGSSTMVGRARSAARY